MTEPAPHVDTSSISFPDGFHEISKDIEGNQYMYANKLTTRCDTPPWVFPPLPDDRINKSPHAELSQKPDTPTESSQPVIHYYPELKPLLPLMKSSLGWRGSRCGNITTKPKSLQCLAGEKLESNSQHKSGSRWGPLTPETAEHARKMRQTGACWSCRLVKVKVI